MSHEIFLKYFIEYLSFCSTHGLDIELYDILYSIFCKLYKLRIGVLDWHIHCARVWYEIMKIVEHSLDFHFGILQALRWSWECVMYFFYRYMILLWNFEYALFLFLVLVDYTPWWKISIKKPIFRPEKMTNILPITFSNGFSFKKNTFFLLSLSVCLSVCLSLSVSVCLSVCLSVCAFHTFLWSSKSFTLPQPANHLFIKINLLQGICTKNSHVCCGLCW